MDKEKKEPVNTEEDYIKELHGKSSAEIDEYIKACAKEGKKDLDNFIKKT